MSSYMDPEDGIVSIYSYMDPEDGIVSIYSYMGPEGGRKVPQN